MPLDQNKFLADLESFLVYLCSDSERYGFEPSVELDYIIHMYFFLFFFSVSLEA